MNDERSLEDKLFTSELYQMAQREFLNKGLEGAADKFLDELSEYIKYGKRFDKDDYPEGEAVAIILKEAIARRMLIDLKNGLLNNDVNQLDVEKLISGKKDEN